MNTEYYQRPRNKYRFKLIKIASYREVTLQILRLSK